MKKINIKYEQHIKQLATKAKVEGDIKSKKEE